MVRLGKEQRVCLVAGRNKNCLIWPQTIARLRARRQDDTTVSRGRRAKTSAGGGQTPWAKTIGHREFHAKPPYPHFYSPTERSVSGYVSTEPFSLEPRNWSFTARDQQDPKPLPTQRFSLKTANGLARSDDSRTFITRPPLLLKVRSMVASSVIWADVAVRDASSSPNARLLRL